MVPLLTTYLESSLLNYEAMAPEDGKRLLWFLKPITWQRLSSPIFKVGIPHAIVRSAFGKKLSAALMVSIIADCCSLGNFFNKSLKSTFATKEA